MIPKQELVRLDFFAEFDDAKLDILSAFCTAKEYLRGTKLFTEGDAADFIWVVADGQVDLRFDLPGRETSAVQTISRAQTGGAIGWSAFVEPYKYRLSAYTTSRTCKMIRLEKSELEKQFTKNPSLGFSFLSKVVRLIGNRFHELQKSLVDAPDSEVKIIVHMGTCGIAKGAREIMTSISDRIAMTNRNDLIVVAGGCMGQCQTEPMVSVEITGSEPVVYTHMTPKKMEEVFDSHIIGGKQITAYLS